MLLFTEEPLSPEMKAEVRLGLRQYQHLYRRDGVYRREIKVC